MRKKTLCLLVVISFIASLLGTALPAQPAAASVPGDMQWVRQSLPPNTTRVSTGPVLLPDGTSLLMVVDTNHPGLIGVWKGTPTPDLSWTFLRAFSISNNPGPFLITPPNYLSNNTIYVFDRAPTGNIRRSTDRGATWTPLPWPGLTNTTPGAGPNNALTGAAFQSASTGYVSDSSGKVYKTTDSAASWTGPFDSHLTNITQLIAQSGTNWVVAGGSVGTTGAIAYSSDGGVNFTKIDLYPNETYRVTLDEAFSDNHIIYFGDSSGTTGNTYRLTIGDAGPVVVDLLAPLGHSAVIALSMRGGTLYSFHPNVVDRTLNPRGTPGPQGVPIPNKVVWSSMDKPPDAFRDSQGIQWGMMNGTANTVGSSNILYMRTGGGSPEPQLWAYSDYLALARPTISPTNPTTVGAGQTVTLTWSSMGVMGSSGLVTNSRIQIKEPADDWSIAASVTLPIDPVHPSVTVGQDGALHFTFVAGKQYQWRVRAADEVSRDVIESLWSETATLVVPKADQTITFGALANKTYGDPPLTVSAIASSNLPVSFSIVSGPATVSGNIVTITGAGAVIVRASQAGNEGYNPAPNVDRSFTVNRADQAISFGALANKTYGDPPFEVSASASSNLPVSFSIASGPATISGNTVTVTGVGTVTVRASQAGNENYNPAVPVSQSFAVNITYDRLNELVDQLVTKQGIVNSLSAKLAAARDAEARGDVDAKAGVIGAFINEVEAQTGKAISPENAAILIALAGAL